MRRWWSVKFNDRARQLGKCTSTYGENYVTDVLFAYDNVVNTRPVGDIVHLCLMPIYGLRLLGLSLLTRAYLYLPYDLFRVYV